jgi:hypothetical protein
MSSVRVILFNTNTEVKRIAHVNEYRIILWRERVSKKEIKRRAEEAINLSKKAFWQWCIEHTIDESDAGRVPLLFPYLNGIDISEIG